MKRSLPLVAIAVLALLGPASVLAAPSPAATTARYFEIQGLVFRGVTVKASGKLAIDGTQFSASAGCNMIGGTVTVEGDLVTLVGPTFMTEMACPGAAGDAEAFLIKILQLGSFTITDTGWTADGGEIMTVELTSSGPGPAGSPPDEPVTSTPGAANPEPGSSAAPGATCPPVPSGTAGSGGGSSSSAGSSGTGGSSAPNSGTAPGSEPGGTPGIDVPPPAPVPGETTSAGPTEPESSPGFILPDPIGQDPNVGKPAGDVCEGFATGGVVEDITALPKAVDTAAEHSAGDGAGQIARVAVALGLLLLVIVAGFYQRAPAVPVDATAADATRR